MPKPKVRRKPVPKPRQGLPKGQWHPELVGVVHNYPKTQEAWTLKSENMRKNVRTYNAEGKATRMGVGDGLRGLGTEIAAARVRADKRAKEIVRKMIENDQINGDDPRAVAALEEMVSIVVAKVKVETEDGKVKEVYVNQARDRISAAKTLLEYTKAKPASKSELKLSTPEDWLKTLR